MTQAASNIHSKSRKSVSRRAALTDAAAKRKRLPSKVAAILHGNIRANVEHAFNLVDAVWVQSGELSPLIAQAVFRELLCDLRAARDQAALLIKPNGRSA